MNVCICHECGDWFEQIDNPISVFKTIAELEKQILELKKAEELR